MARSSLFRALRRLGRKQPPPANAGWRRREFLRTFGLAAAALPVLGCGDDTTREGPKIAVIGGGIAGLTASHFLGLAGVRADVYEASMRSGGRMFTQGGLPGGQLVELGGELVDSNHLVVPALCAQLGLQLDDLVDATEGLQQDIFFFNNAKLTETAIVNAFTPVAAKMQLNLLASEGEDDASVAEFERIDAMSIPEWLSTEAGLPASSLIKELLEVAYREEYGLEVDEQSAWNMLFLIDSETPDPFRVFGDSDERFHIHTGSGSLTDALAERLEDRINLDHRLVSVVQGDRITLTFATTAGDEVVEVDHVIYALPFTKLREVDLSASGLSAEKLEVINEIGYGTNAKLMMQFTDRHWEAAPARSAGGVITDVGELQTLWATTRGQPGTQGILTNFVGGARGLAIGDGTAESQATGILADIEKIFPGITAKYVAGSAIRQHWPTAEFAKGSYACYRVGQWRFFGTEGIAEDTQHFCGEHCSEDFQGYMEGGADTGALVAAEILEDLRIALPASLASILIMTANKRVRASYHGTYGRRMKLSQIRRRG